MVANNNVWAIVLAAGEGRRVRALTRDRWGQPAPKQFSLIDGCSTFLSSTLERARKLVPADRIVPIVAAQHRRWWAPELTEIPQHNVIIQPENRGTAAGILLPLLWISRLDTAATAVVLPSDHFVTSEETLMVALTDAISAVTRSDVPVMLLGIRPNGPEEEYGWIVPRAGGARCPCHVASFKEKPDASTSARLLQGGALLNSFIIVADVRRLLALFREALPQLWQPFEVMTASATDASWTGDDLATLYRSIPAFDFSRDLLEGVADRLWVYPVPPCGWSDLGTPERLTHHAFQHHGVRLASVVEGPMADGR